MLSHQCYNMVTYMIEESPHLLLLLLLLQGQYCAGLVSLTIIKYSSIAPQKLSELVAMIYPGTTAVIVVVVLVTDGLQLLLVYVGHLKV